MALPPIEPTEPVTARPDWNTGGGDDDVPFRFGRHPITSLHARDYARLLLLRSRLGDNVVLLRHRQPDAEAA